MAVDLPTLFAANKELPLAPTWRERDPDRLTLVVPLDIGQVTIEGFRLRMTAMKSLSEEAVTIQLEYNEPTRRSAPMARIDWKPLHRHNNKGHGPTELQNIIQSGSHNHGFDLNWRLAPKFVRRGSLPIAVPMSPDPKNFFELLDFVKREFRINNIALVPAPPWQSALDMGFK